MMIHFYVLCWVYSGQAQETPLLSQQQLEGGCILGNLPQEVVIRMAACLFCLWPTSSHLTKNFKAQLRQYKGVDLLKVLEAI